MTVIGTVELIATINTSQYKKGVSEIQKDNQKLESSGSNTANKLNTGFSTVAKVGMAAVATAAIAVGAIIVKNIGSAIKRVDTLDNSARTFANMGFATDSVKKSMTALEKSIQGLPTSLDEGVRGMTSLSATYGDIEKGQKVFTALNNAILGFGGTSDSVNNAILQLSQLPMDGPLDAQTWNSLRNSGLTPVLVAMSKDMGISVNEMKKKFGEGELKVKDFTNRLVDMNTKGGGGMKSLEKIAKDSTKGIGTGWQNLQTAVTRGIGAIIKAIGSENISNAITSIGKGLETILKWLAPIAKISIAGLVTAFTVLGEAIDWTVEAMTPLINILKVAWDIMKPLRDFVATQFKQAWKDIKAAFDEAYKALQPYLPQLKQLGLIIGGVILVALAAFVAAVVGVILIVAKLISWMVKLGSWFAKTWSSAHKFGVNVVNSIKNAMINAISWVTRTFSSLVSYIKALPRKIKSGLGSLGSLLVQAGKNLIDGLIRGIKAAPGKVVDAIKSIASGAKNAFKSFLGIKSPSKVFAEYGGYITQGLVNGITGGFSEIDGAVSKMAGATISPIVNSDFDNVPAAVSNKSIEIGTINIASDYDANKLLNTLGIKQNLYDKGVV